MIFKNLCKKSETELETIDARNGPTKYIAKKPKKQIFELGTHFRYQSSRKSENFGNYLKKRRNPPKVGGFGRKLYENVEKSEKS